VLEKVKDAGEAGKQLSLRDGKLSNFNAQNIVCLLEESAKRCVVFDVEEGAEVWSPKTNTCEGDAGASILRV
jgi:hypothetical protein